MKIEWYTLLILTLALLCALILVETQAREMDAPPAGEAGPEPVSAAEPDESDRRRQAGQPVSVRVHSALDTCRGCVKTTQPQGGIGDAF